MAQINTNIKNLRKKKGYTQARVAEMIGMKTSTYSQMERLGNVPAQIVLDLAAVFEVDPMEIMDPEKRQLINTESSGIGRVAQPSINIETALESDEITLTNREKNAIIMLRNIKSADREEIYTAIKEAHDKKFKKR